MYNALERAASPAEDFEFSECFGDGMQAYGYTGQDEDVVIPGEYDGLPVLRVGGLTFCGNRTLRSVVIPEGVTVIDEGAFAACEALRSVRMPQSLREIAAQAFSGCGSLREICIPGGVKQIAGNAFMCCPALQEFIVDEASEVYCAIDGVLFHRDSGTLAAYPAGREDERYTTPEDTTIIGADAFHSCAHLQELTLQPGVRTLRRSAFAQCGKLRRIRVPATVEEIEPGLINECPEATFLVAEGSEMHRYAQKNGIPFEVDAVPDKVKENFLPPELADPEDQEQPEDRYATRPVEGGCEITGYEGKGGWVRIPDEIGGVPVVSLGGYAFRWDSGVKQLAIPAGITRMDPNALNGCVELDWINVDEKNPAFIGDHGVLYTSRGTLRHYPIARQEESFAVPFGIRRIGCNVFVGCKHLRQVTLPDTLEIIDQRAFSRCENLRSICLPASVKKIEGCFYECASLEDVTLNEGLEEIGERTFALCPSLRSLTIPESVKRIGKLAFWRSGQLVLRVYENSRAHIWAAENKVPFEVIRKKAPSLFQRLFGRK